jgi:hypothetical protein
MGPRGIYIVGTCKKCPYHIKRRKAAFGGLESARKMEFYSGFLQDIYSQTSQSARTPIQRSGLLENLPPTAAAAVNVNSLDGRDYKEFSLLGSRPSVSWTRRWLIFDNKRTNGVCGVL